MDRFAHWAGAALLLAGTALHAGCSGNAGVTTSSVQQADVPNGTTNDSPMARPTAVAWTAARAKRCGFYFDPAKLKVNYLAYERTQGATSEQLANIEKAYDQGYKFTTDKINTDADYCNERRGLEIKQDLQRHLAGDYRPNLPVPKQVANCGFFGCGVDTSNEPMDSKKFWQEKDRNPTNRR
jgi:hypothetical protein